MFSAGVFVTIYTSLILDLSGGLKGQLDIHPKKQMFVIYGVGQKVRVFFSHKIKDTFFIFTNNFIDVSYLLHGIILIVLN